ncbi:ras-related protein Rap-2c-like [Tachyglossus aculeatus]|uniref:ras-related protein Rap-2c-like n=1 Tax=Tachyglossus aculeatus TaxID=9261 RepID=UPI0018F38B42|nr:ras-related protein Rap-2c-like [Tachyglossus aculeatus]
MSAERSSVRVVFFGAAGVGKTALIQRFLAGTFEAQHRRTVEELHCLDYELGRQRPPLRLEIMDTSGSYSFPAMRRLGIRRGDAFALVYSLQEPESFQEVRRLRDEILEAKGRQPCPPILLVGNKSDLAPAGADPRLHLDWGDPHLEASAKLGDNVPALFRQLLLLLHLPGRLSPVLRHRRRRRTFPESSSSSSAQPSGTPAIRKSHSCTVS